MKKDLSKGSILGLAHVGIPVRDIQKSKEFYSTILDMNVVHENYVDEKEGRTKVCFVENNGLTLELYQKALPTNVKEDGPIHHIAFKVKNIEAIKEKLEKKCMEFLKDEIVYCENLFNNGAKWILFRGPDNELIELNEIM